MKRVIIKARKIAMGRIVQHLRRGRKPFHGARGPAGPKDVKDLRGAKGALLREAEELADAGKRPTTARRASSRSSSTTARR